MSIPRTYLLLVAALAAAFSMALPPAALAAAGSPSAGVHVDPSSPVAKEYALPLATARGAPADTGSTGALFGHGITKTQSKRPGEASGGGSGGQNGGAPQSGSSTPQTPSTPVVATTSTPAVATAPAASSAPATGTHGGRPNRYHRHQGVTSGTSPAPARTGIASGRPHRAGGTHPSAAPAATQILHPGSVSGWLWMLVAACAVLAAGSAGAFLLVRVYRRDPNPN